MQETFKVPEVSCGHCKATVEGALQPVEGVSEAVVDIDGKTVAVTYDETTVDRAALIAAIESSGYAVAV